MLLSFVLSEVFLPPFFAYCTILHYGLAVFYIFRLGLHSRVFPCKFVSGCETFLSLGQHVHSDNYQGVPLSCSLANFFYLFILNKFHSIFITVDKQFGSKQKKSTTQCFS